MVATAGLPEVARAEADAVKRFASAGQDLGEEPWHRWEGHRFSLSAERLKAFLDPPGAYLDTIELAARWTVLPKLHAEVKSAIAIGGLALCHFSHAYEQGCCAYFSFGGSADTEAEARAAYGRAWEGAMTAALGAGSDDKATITGPARHVRGWSRERDGRLDARLASPQRRSRPDRHDEPSSAGRRVIAAPVLFIVNPASGAGKAAREWSGVAAWLSTTGLPFDAALYHTPRRGDRDRPARGERVATGGGRSRWRRHFERGGQRLLLQWRSPRRRPAGWGWCRSAPAAIFGGRCGSRSTPKKRSTSSRPERLAALRRRLRDLRGRGWGDRRAPLHQHRRRGIGRRGRASRQRRQQAAGQRCFHHRLGARARRLEEQADAGRRRRQRHRHRRPAGGGRQLPVLRRRDADGAVGQTDRWRIRRHPGWQRGQDRNRPQARQHPKWDTSG